MLIDRQTHASESNSASSRFVAAVRNSDGVVVVVVAVSSLNCFAQRISSVFVCSVAFVKLAATATLCMDHDAAVAAVNGILCSINLSTFSFYYLIRSC